MILSGRVGSWGSHPQGDAPSPRGFAQRGARMPGLSRAAPTAQRCRCAERGWEQPSVPARPEERARATRAGLKPQTDAESETGRAGSPASRDGRSLLQRTSRAVLGAEVQPEALWQELSLTQLTRSHRCQPSIILLRGVRRETGMLRVAQPGPSAFGHPHRSCANPSDGAAREHRAQMGTGLSSPHIPLPYADGETEAATQPSAASALSQPGGPDSHLSTSYSGSQGAASLKIQ